jgi:hypothetical protein
MARQKGELGGRRAAEYQHQLRVHRRIQAIYPMFAALRLHFRAPRRVAAVVPQPVGHRSGVDADRVFCALAAKASETKRAVVALCQRGYGRAALALTRTLLENAVMCEWMLRGEGTERLDTYVVFASVIRERGVRKLQRFDSGRSALHRSNPYDQAIAEHVFGDKHDTWSYFPSKAARGGLDRVTIARMFEEVAGKSEPEEYALWYSMGSDEIHSSPLSLTPYLVALNGRSTFVLDTPPWQSDEHLPAVALAMSNSAMLLVLDALNQYARAGLENKIDRVKAFMRESPPVTPSQASGRGARRRL